MEGIRQATTGAFCKMAVGSLFELQTQIEIAFNLEYITKDLFEAFFEQTKELDRMLFSLISKIKWVQLSE